MLRTFLVSLGAGLLAVTLLAAAPSPASASKFDSYGTATSRDHKLRQGCHKYSFNYKITTPTNDWSAEFFVIRPDGVRLLSDLVDVGSDPRRATRPWSTQICSQSAPYGRYKIKMKITYTDGRDKFDGFVKPTTFRFTRR